MSNDLKFAAEASPSQIDVPEVTNPNVAETEPTVEMPTGGLQVNPISIEETEPKVAEPVVAEPEVTEANVKEEETINAAKTFSELENKTEEEKELVATSKPGSEAEESSNNVPVTGNSSQTRLQLQKTVLYHLQTETKVEIPLNLNLIRIGKPNQQVPPDVDVSGFPNAEVVSRVHAHIRVEGDAYFLEDMGSSNGTYINHSPLPTGNRHRLRSGDRFSLGKGDLMTFIFQIEGSL